MPVVHAPASDRHDVATGVWCGVTEASDELPERAAIIRRACEDAGAIVHTATEHGLEPLARVHTAAFLDVLATAYERWVADGHLTDPGAP